MDPLSIAGGGQSVMKLIWCNGLPEIHSQLTQVGTSCLRVHLIWKLDLILPGDRSSENGRYILSEGTPCLKTWPNSAWGQVIWKLGGTFCLRVHLIWKLKILPGDRSSENYGGMSCQRVQLIWKCELTCCFMLCFTEGLFILHTKDLIRVSFL